MELHQKCCPSEKEEVDGEEIVICKIDYYSFYDYKFILDDNQPLTSDTLRFPNENNKETVHASNSTKRNVLLSMPKKDVGCDKKQKTEHDNEDLQGLISSAMSCLDRSTENNFRNVIDVLREKETPKFENSLLMQMLNNQQVQVNQHSEMISKQFEMLNKQNNEITRMMSLITAKLEDNVSPYLLSTQTKIDEMTNETKEKEINDENKND